MLCENVGLRADEAAVIIIDQTLLPQQRQTVELCTAPQMFAAIRDLQVRGAPAIGICSAYCLYVLARQIASGQPPREEFDRGLRQQAELLNSARPTAVNLSWALHRLLRAADSQPQLTPQQLLPLLREEAVAIQQEDMDMCRAISEHGLSLLHDGMGVLTHCNAGPLATSRYGTALGPLLLGAERGLRLRAFADETRPLLQGARLTSYELQRGGVDVTLICDNMASIVMSQGWVEACFVGCDRVAMNGDTANKIGTSGVAILARYYNIPFYVLGPSSTVDRSCASGRDIPIELRDPAEIKEKFYLQAMAPETVKCYNPAFDVTDHTLISGIITERGICRPPYARSLAALFD